MQFAINGLHDDRPQLRLAGGAVRHGFAARKRGGALHRGGGRIFVIAAWCGPSLAAGKSPGPTYVRFLGRFYAI